MEAQGSARYVNIILGAWLFISAFLWHHSPSEYINAWLIGLLVVLTAFVGFWVEQVRYVNTALAVWLFLSAWALPRLTVGTTWNHALVGIAIFIASLIPNAAPATDVRKTSGTSTMHDAHST
jgi:hypothetical protein